MDVPIYTSSSSMLELGFFIFANIGSFCLRNIISSCRYPTMLLFFPDKQSFVLVTDLFLQKKKGGNMYSIKRSTFYTYCFLFYTLLFSLKLYILKIPI